MSLNRIVIVGAGQAAASAIIELRQNKFEGEIVLIGDEAHLPYERPPLSKEVILKPEETKVEILSQQKLQDLDVEVILNAKAEKIDREMKTVVLSSGEQVSYDKLLIATGASPRKLPIVDNLGERVYTLRRLEDAHALCEIFQPDRHLILIGGGVIGLELASSARAKGAEVTVIEAGSTLMGRCAPQFLSEFLLTEHQKAGIEILFNRQISEVKLENNYVVLSLTDGTQLFADAIIYGIGVIPNAQLASEAGLNVDFAIQVNENCQTSDPDIYAAGDVATQLRADGQYARVETWENANLQAATFARHVLGLEHPKANAPWFWTDQLDFNIQLVGDMSAREWKVSSCESKNSSTSFVAYGLNDGVVVAGITVNAARSMRVMKKIVNNKQTYESLNAVFH